MSASQTEVVHPYVERRPGVCGGSPVIVGTRFPVRSVVGYVLKLRMTPEDLAREFPSLTLAQIHGALSFYYDHQSEIDQEILENSEEYCGERFQSSTSRTTG